MSYKTLTILMVGAVSLLLTSFAPAEQPAEPRPNDTPPTESRDVMLARGRPILLPPGSEQVSPPPVGNDPTQPSASLRDALGAVKGRGNPGANRLPLITIKGRIIAKDKLPAILLEVDGRVYRIFKGTVMNGLGNTTLKVTDLTRSEVTILVSPQNETMVLH